MKPLHAPSGFLFALLLPALAGAAPAASSDGAAQDRAAMYERNALARCQALPSQDRAECEARVRQGSTSGSVRDGGVLREHRTVVPAATPAPAGSAPR